MVGHSELRSNIPHNVLLVNNQTVDGSLGCVDDLSFSYDSNRLVKVSDRAEAPTYEGSFDFKDSADGDEEYLYDANGNMIVDRNKVILSIACNELNLPNRIGFSRDRSTRYVYRADGKKLRAVYQPLFPLSITTTDYCGNLVFEDGKPSRLLFAGGYTTFGASSQPRFHFHLTDHLGGNRVVADATGRTEQANHYYPFGGLLAESTHRNVQKHLYNGKELDCMHGLYWHDYGARHYDACRFVTMDPLCEKYNNTSPYVYCHNNPVNAVDPDGRELRLFHDAYELVIGTLPIEEREFIQINDNGFIRKDILAKAVNSGVASQNLQYLNMIVQDERIIDYYGSVSEARVRYDASGKGNFQNMIIRFQAPTRGSDVDLLVESAIAGGSILPIDKLREIYIKQGHSTEYTVQGNLGLTVRPAEMQVKYPNLGQQALSKNIEVYTSSVGTTKLDRILNAGHELYSHVAFYLEEKDGRHDGTMNDALNMRESQVRYDILRYNCNLK